MIFVTTPDEDIQTLAADHGFVVSSVGFNCLPEYPLATVAELLEQRAALEKQIAEAQREERASAIAQVRALMSQYGLSAADLAGRAAGPKAPRAKSGSTVAPKYRDPATGKTWSGRGLKPTWLRTALANGKSLGDFAI